jgi:hypothetical protein
VDVAPAPLPPPRAPLLLVDEELEDPLVDEVVPAPPTPGSALPAAQVTPDAASPRAAATMAHTEIGRRGSKEDRMQEYRRRKGRP